MDMKRQRDELEKRYGSFEADTADYRKDAACVQGCAFCCTDAGSIDITTLEGLVIREAVEKMPRPRRMSIQKALERDMKKREARVASPCPFLTKSDACAIYDVRPFACRRIYSLHSCSNDRPPLLSRHVMECGQRTIEALQRLDGNGYSGHISFVLYMLEAPRFLETYLAGGFKPDELMAFGKTHRIVINRMMT